MRIETKAEFVAMIEAGKQFHLPNEWPPISLSKVCGKYYVSTPNMKNGVNKGTCKCFDTIDELWSFRERFPKSELHCFATGMVA